MYTYNIDLHLHTSVSFDCIDKLDFKIKAAEKTSLDIIAITDHNSIESAIKAQEIVLLKGSKLKIIIGEEISTDKGDIIGLFINRLVKPGKLKNVINEIKSQGGILYLPHPFKRSNIWQDSESLQYIDIVEVFNSRNSYEENYKALIFAIHNKKLMGCGSDSHTLSEVGRCKMRLISSVSIDNNLNPNNFLNLIRESQQIEIYGTCKNHIFLEIKSQFLKMLKTKNLSPIKYGLTYILKELVLKGNPDTMLIIKDSSGYRLCNE